jgi:hypothetical protein
MVHLASAFVVALASISARALPFTETTERTPSGLVSRATTPNSQGQSGGFFYQFCRVSHNMREKWF